MTCIYVIDHEGDIWARDNRDSCVVFCYGADGVGCTVSSPLHLVPVLFDPAFGYGNIDFAPIWHEDT